MKARAGDGRHSGGWSVPAARSLGVRRPAPPARGRVELAFEKIERLRPLAGLGEDAPQPGPPPGYWLKVMVFAIGAGLLVGLIVRAASTEPA